MIRKLVILIIILIISSINSSFADNSLSFENITLNLGEGLYTSQTNSNRLFGYNGGAEAEINTLLKITDTYKLRIGLGFINRDMWTKFPRSTTVRATIRPISTSFVIYSACKNGKSNKNYKGAGLTYYPAKLTYKEYSESTAEFIENRTSIKTYGLQLFIGVERLLFPRIYWVGEIMFRNVDFSFDSKEFSLNGFVFKLGLGYYFGNRE